MVTRYHVLVTRFMLSYRLGATATVLRKREVLRAGPDQHWVAEVLVRKVPDDQQVKQVYTG